MNKKIIACVIVRMNSTRLPRKALSDLNGLPLTLQLIKRLKLSKNISNIVVCTSNHPSDAILLEKASEWGVDSYAGSQKDVLSRLINVSNLYNADAVLRITGDNPFTDADNIDRLIEHHINTSSEYTRTNRLPLGVTAEVMDANMLKKLHKSIPNSDQTEYMSFFAFNSDMFHCEVLDPIKGQDRPFYSLTVDYPEELELARKIYRAISISCEVPNLDSVIQYLDQDPDYKPVDKNKIIKLPDGNEMKYSELIDMLDDEAEKSKLVNGKL